MKHIRRKLIGRISNKIVNEVSSINLVDYGIGLKARETIVWQ